VGGSGAKARRAWPLLPLAPMVVILLGLAVAFAIGIVGVSALAKASDASSEQRADLLASTLAARLAQLPPNERFEAMQHAARKTGAELILVTATGDIALDASLGMASGEAIRRVVRQSAGEATTALGRARFAVRALPAQPSSLRPRSGEADGTFAEGGVVKRGDVPSASLRPRSGEADGTFAEGGVVKRGDVPSLSLVAFVREPSAPEERAGMLRALVALTAMLVVVAAAVAYAVTQDANKDVDFVARRVGGMVHVRSEPTGEAVPVRSIDEVGALTVAFNALVGRFAAAQASYETDLERVRAADRDRAAFLAAVSHELRSPLNAILGFADILMTEVDGPLTPEAREEVDQIREFSALESGQLKLSRTCVDLGTLASEVVREAQGLVGRRPVRVRLEEESGIRAHADPRRVRQVLTNLIGNAVKFTLDGEVVVRVHRDGPWARVSVRDTGPGISAQERALIFQEYKQTKEERTKRRGTGLGLAIARRLVLMHGGRIVVDSKIGEGSTFAVLLPPWDVPSSSLRTAAGVASRQS
jgi:signal transduction histidine kinase